MEKRTYVDINDQEIMYLIDLVEMTDKSYIDGRILGGALKLIYFCGFKKSEIINLKIKHVIRRGGGVVDELQSCQKIVAGTIHRITIPNCAKDIIRNHLLYLKRKGYRYTRNDPLFPQRNKLQYEERKLGKDLAKFSEKIQFEDIRRAGIYREFNQLKKKEGFDKEIAFREVAEYARTSIKHIKNIIVGTRDYRPKRVVIDQAGIENIINLLIKYDQIGFSELSDFTYNIQDMDVSNLILMKKLKDELFKAFDRSESISLERKERMKILVINKFLNKGVKF